MRLSVRPAASVLSQDKMFLTTLNFGWGPRRVQVRESTLLKSYILPNRKSSQ